VLLVIGPVEVRPFALCVDGLELNEELRNTPNPGSGRVVVSLSAPGELRVRATWPDGQSLERKVPAQPSECAAVRRIVLALIRAWLASPPAPVPRPPEPLPPPPRPVERRVERPPVETPVIPPPPPPVRVEPPAPVVPPEPAPEPPTEPEPPPDVLHETVALTEPLPPAPETHWQLGVGALGGLMAGPTPTPAGAGAFFVELTRNRRLGLGLEAGLESSRSGTAAFASQRWLTLYARGEVPVHDRVRFAATLGVRGWAVEVGAPALPARTLFGGGGALTVGPEVTVGPVVLLVRGTFAVRLPEERISIAGNSALFLKWWQVGALAGLAWRFP
jgi:hypothetical protein